MRPPNDRSESNQDSSPERTAQALLNLRCAVDHCHDAIVITDPDSCIESVNLGFEALTGFSVRDSIGEDRP
jgi:PAS domain-containing protein